LICQTDQIKRTNLKAPKRCIYILKESQPTNSLKSVLHVKLGLEIIVERKIGYTIFQWFTFDLLNMSNFATTYQLILIRVLVDCYQNKSVSRYQVDSQPIL